ncbi:uncharacterized protein DMENIID0001_038480 [Sergentomyia squamirostris]
MGTTDRHRHFHYIALAMCSTETSEDYEFVLRTVKEWVERLSSSQYSPRTVIADGALAIRNAAQLVFKDILVKMCWFHVIQAVRNKLPNLFTDESLRKQILTDIRTMHKLTSDRKFKAAAILFLKKWKKESDFVKYFEREWLKLRINWHEGENPEVPSTNNSLEANNRVIKDFHTLRARPTVAIFRSELIRIVTDISLEFEGKQFETSHPKFSAETWEAALHWISQRKPRYYIGRNCYTTASSYMRSEEWKTFEDVQKNAFRQPKVFKPKHQQISLENAKCTCTTFSKKLVCKHTVGICAIVKTIPESELKAVIKLPLGRHGRPKKARKALVRM